MSQNVRMQDRSNVTHKEQPAGPRGPLQPRGLQSEGLTLLPLTPPKPRPSLHGPMSQRSCCDHPHGAQGSPKPTVVSFLRP